MALDHLLRHVGGDAAEEHACLADPEQLRDRPVEVFLREIAEAGVVDEIEVTVLERQFADVAQEVAVPPFRDRAGMDMR